MDISFLKYHHWANIKLMDHLGTIPETILNQEIQSVFPSVMRTLQHIYEVDKTWLHRINQSLPTHSVPLFSSILEARSSFLELQQQYQGTLEEELKRNSPIIYTNSTGTEFMNSLEEIITHIVNHGTYHRGNISAMLRQLDTKSVSTDYIFYLRESASN
ncbi:DinB family protein [Ectobacillus funiculus]|uniref:DinB family protein n=1 Tax=Ectobacillus funiculus TaxID=137993 RepID=A0ABV5WI56_9BACI